MKRYVAHLDKVSGREQTVAEHLEGVACLAKKFASVFNAGSIAYRCGMIHDIGKYSNAFQKRILEDGPKIDHSTAGALEAYKAGDVWSAFCIAGHHGGIPDGGNAKSDCPDDATLMGRMKRTVGKHIPDYSDFQIDIKMPETAAPDYVDNRGFNGSFFVRMLFSALVDADFLDTERFMTGGNLHRGDYDDIEELLDRLNEYIRPWWAAKGELNKRRCAVLQACISSGEKQQGVYKLTVPTGGGKTVSSLAFALRHAKEHGLKRIIYVIPYTNIIEQTAQVFSDIVGRSNVLEHHAYADYDLGEDADDTNSIKKRLSAENWDAPIVVTTSVQFFESLFSNKPSRCRKLHNIAGSVLIFDEAQMLPTAYLKPCVAALYELSVNYGCTVVLCTATQPSLDKLFKAYSPECHIEDIYQDYPELFKDLRRVRFERDGVLSDAELSEHLNVYPQVLCIVNRRDEAQTVYKMLKAEGRYHLSTRMTPFDRRERLKEIRGRLQNGLICRVVSTSLVEAGVDLDFPTVYRAEAGLDSILQAAGRCNREGRKSPDESVVHIFQTQKPVPRMFEQNAAAARAIMRDYSDFSAPKAVSNYFDLLHTLKGTALDQKRIMNAWDRGIDGVFLPFNIVAQQFKLIENDTKTIYIPIGHGADCVRRFREGERNRRLFREAGLFALEVYSQEYRALYEVGVLEVLDERISVLLDLTLYSSDTGLLPAVETGHGLFI